MSKRVVLLSTYTIEAKVAEYLLSGENVSASLFKSPLLYRYFIRRLPEEDKEMLYEKLGIEHNVDEDAIKRFIESRGLGNILPFRILGALQTWEDKMQYKELRSGYSVDSFVKAVEDKSMEDLNKAFEGVSAPNIIFSRNRYKEKNSFADRFSLYTLNTDTETDCVYAVWPLKTQADPREDWLEALCDEVLLRHPDKDIKIYLVLHGKDLYERQAFKVEELLGEKVSSERNNRKYQRACVVFEHVNDPVSENILTKGLNPEEVVEMCDRLLDPEVCNILYGDSEKDSALKQLRENGSKIEKKLL